MPRQSELRKFVRCRRAWWWQYVEGLRPVRTGPDGSGRGLGSLVHTALEAYYRNEDDWLAAMKATIPEGEEHEWADSYNLATIMVEGYVDWAQQTGVDAGLTVLDVELPWELEISGVTLTGTLDLAALHHDYNGPVILDHKTVQNLGGQLPPQNDFQLLTYALAYWHTTDRLPVAVGHNMLRKVQRTGRAKPPFYDRHFNHCNQQMLEKHARHLAMLVDESEEIKAIVGAFGGGVEHEVLYPNPTRDCTWDCDFRDVCPLVDDGSDYAHIIDTAYEVRGQSDEEGEELHE